MLCPFKFLRQFSLVYITAEEATKAFPKAKEDTWGCEGSKCVAWIDDGAHGRPGGPAVRVGHCGLVHVSGHRRFEDSAPRQTVEPK